jgi:hypothetical protein
MKHNAMRWVRKKSCSAFHRSQNAGFAFDTQIDVQIGLVGHKADERFRLMCVEVVYDEMPLHNLRVSGDRALDMREKVFFLTGGASRNLPDLALRHMEVDDERQRAMPDVLKFPAQDMPWKYGQVRMLGLQGLDAGHFIP